MLHILHGSWCEQECLHKERERGGEACESLLALNSEFRAQYIIVSQMLY